ncbi:MAG TPA: hypothetical protein VGJ07_05170 [Rugosimonospora sp.]
MPGPHDGPETLAAHLPPGFGPPLDSLLDAHFVAARDAINQKAAQLSPAFTGASNGAIQSAPGIFADEKVFFQRYDNCTIYFGPRTGAHEINGGIRSKYDSINGLELLGVPVTDESPCADGTGRYNHFDKDGSIFWHPDTGPFWINGALRGEWSRRGWEQGSLGYPLRDTFQPVPEQSVVLFQAGALCYDGQRVTDAPSAYLSRDSLLTYVWRTFDRIVHQSPDNIGLYPQHSIDAVSNSYGDFVRARNRVITFTINGFHDAGLLLPDQNWSAHFQVLVQEADFHTPPPDAAQTDPGHDLIASHLGNTVDAGGIGPGAVANGISHAISDAFPIRLAAPDPRKPLFPKISGFIGALVAPDGGVNLLFVDTVAGRLAALAANRAIEALLD